MNLFCDVAGGGIFSKFALCIQSILPIWHISKVEKIYLNHVSKLVQIPNPFDLIYDQNPNLSYVYVNSGNRNTYLEIHKSNDLPYLKEIVSKLKYKQSILDNIEKIRQDLNITDRTLGVHLRLGDMNMIHGDMYGVVYYEHFQRKIDEALKSGQYDNIFAASDNFESIEKLINRYGDKIRFCNSLMRLKNEDDDGYKFQIDNFSTPEFWLNSYYDMLLLSKCGGIIYRVSNFANASIMHSNTIKNYYKL